MKFSLAASNFLFTFPLSQARRNVSKSCGDSDKFFQRDTRIAIILPRTCHNRCKAVFWCKIVDCWVCIICPIDISYNLFWTFNFLHFLFKRKVVNQKSDILFFAIFKSSKLYFFKWGHTKQSKGSTFKLNPPGRHGKSSMALRFRRKETKWQNTKLFILNINFYSNCI